jgi:hypothetical protein
MNHGKGLSMIALVFALALSLDPGIVPPAHRTVEPRLQPMVLLAEPPAPVLVGVAVTLECTAHRDGRVGECRVLGETHPGLGFVAAAIALTNGSEVSPGPHDIQFARTLQFLP